MRERECDIRAIVSMVFKCVGSPCRRTSVTVCTVPVDGAQVMLNGVPAVIDVRVVNVNGFCAAASAENVAMTSEAGSEKRIFAFFFQIPS
jgi:hypothetical protein